MAKNQSWGGRFKQETNQFVQTFTASATFDKVLATYDIQGSLAHTEVLYAAKVLSKKEKDIIIKGLNTILAEINNNEFSCSIQLEDVHMNVEARLTELCGEVGKKLHTARSRNDQIATDMRLYLRAECGHISNHIKALQQTLLDLAALHTTTVMPGFTHLQNAQPISFGHHLMAYFEMFARDYERLQDGLKRINKLPLGAAALAGTTYPIDRKLAAKILGFDDICENSIDAVSDRDFIIEFNATTAMIMMHLSRFSEEVVLWCCAQFNFIELGDTFCTGSSIMPQKKNPDVAELIRGKTSRTYGNLMALLTLMKSQPLAYNKDNQEDKEPLFDSVNTVKDCLYAFSEMLKTITVNKVAMRKSAEAGFITATDLADYLVKKGCSFRDAHHIVGAVVAYCIDKHKTLDQLTLSELTPFSDKITNDVFACFDIDAALKARNHLGGTAPQQVSALIAKKQRQL